MVKFILDLSKLLEEIGKKSLEMKKTKKEQNQMAKKVRRVLQLIVDRQVSPIHQKEPTITQKVILTKNKSLKRPRTPINSINLEKNSEISQDFFEDQFIGKLISNEETYKSGLDISYTLRDARLEIDFINEKYRLKLPVKEEYETLSRRFAFSILYLRR